MDLLSQHEAFLRAIYDAPDDDTPRLVYADFLQENGEEDRAAFIRVQCELAHPGGDLDRRRALESREWALYGRLYPDRVALAGPYFDAQVEAVRGFLTDPLPLVVTDRTLLDPVADRWRMVRERPETFAGISLGVERGLLLRPEHIELVFKLPAAQRVTEWQLGGSVHEVPTARAEDGFGLIDIVQKPAVSTAGVEALAGHRGARRVTALDLRNNSLDNDAARALVKSPYLDNLKRLQLLEGNRLRGKVWQQVIERFGEDVVG